MANGRTCPCAARISSGDSVLRALDFQADFQHRCNWSGNPRFRKAVHKQFRAIIKKLGEFEGFKCLDATVTKERAGKTRNVKSTVSMTVLVIGMFQRVTNIHNAALFANLGNVNEVLHVHSMLVVTPHFPSILDGPSVMNTQVDPR